MFYKLNCNRNVIKINLSNKIIMIKLMILVVFIYVHVFSQELLTDFFSYTYKYKTNIGY